MAQPFSETVSPWRLPPLAAFIGAVVGFATLFVAAGAPTPLLAFLERAWGFAPWLLTLAFAIYAFGLVGALLAVGALSDRLGRRPVLVGALTLQLLAIVLFTLAPNIIYLIVARAIQGLATGAATGAFTAFISELAPAHLKPLGGVLSSVAPVGGLSLGVALTGLAVQFTAHPNIVVFTTLGILTAIVLVATVFTRETLTPRSGVSHASVPRRIGAADERREFVAAIPVHVSAWMSAGLFLGLGPSVLREVLHLEGGALTGLIIALEPGAAVVAALVLSHVSGRTTTLLGGGAVLVGTVLVGFSLLLGELPLFVLSVLISGFGFGGSFSGALRTTARLAPPDRRAALFASIYLVAYLAFGVPVLIAGLFIRPLGLLPTVIGYALVIAACAVIGLLTQWRQARSDANPARSLFSPSV